MSYKKHSWVKYGSQGEIVEIIIRDSTGGKIDSFKVNNQKSYAQILQIIKRKYGLSPNIKEENKIEGKTWLEKDMEW